MALTNQEQIEIDGIDTRVSVNSGNISKNEADIQGIDNENYFKLVNRSFVYSGCEINKSGSDLSISISNGSDSKSISIVDGKYLEVSDKTVFVSANTSGSTRIDLAYLSREGGLLIKAGLAGSGLAPSLPSNSLELYTLSIPTGTTVNLSAGTLLDRRVNVNSGHYLPTAGIALNESFLLTQQDGENLVGLYYWDGGSWNILSSGGLVANYYTKESVDVLAAGMTEAEFRARQKENKRNNDGSGFTKFGSNYALGSRDEINKGMFTRISSIKDTYSKYLYLTSDCEISTNGSIVKLKDIESIAGFDNSIALPDAPTDEKARQDLIGLEYWEEETDNVHPKGCTQSSATLLNGIATVIPTFSGADTYSRFGTWQAAGELIGRIVKFSTATVLQKMAMLSDPENCLFFNELGNLTQGKNRIRVIQGLTSNGAEWNKIKADNNATGDPFGILNYGGISTSAVKPKGKNTSIISDLANIIDNTTGYFVNIGNLFNNNNEKKKIGGFVALHVDSISGKYDTLSAYKGNCFFMPIAMVSRNRNQGLYHPVHNDEGTMKASDDKYWYDTGVSFTSTADCFDSVKLLAASGSIASGKSGHWKGLYYDEISASDVRDLRLPSNYKKTISNELSKINKSNRRGYESKFEIKHKNKSGTLDAVSQQSDPIGSYTRLQFTNEDIFGVGSGVVGNISYLDKNFLGFVKGNSQYYETIAFYYNGSNTYIYIHPKHGNVTADFTISSSYSSTISIKTDKFQDNVKHCCEILGDPSNLASAFHEGVFNLINVNTGLSNLPIDAADVGGGSEGKKFLMSAKAVTFSSDTVVFVTNSTGDPVLFTRGSFGSALQWDAVDNDNELYINFTQSWATLGYASRAVMVSDCNVIAFFEGYTNGFVASPNEEVENLEYSQSFQTQRLQASYGAKVANDLLGKVLVDSSFGSTAYKSIIEAHIDAPADVFFTSSSNFIKESSLVAFTGASNKPAIKYFLYQTNKNGLLYNVLVYKEMKFSGDWGDNQKFDITNNMVTTTDDNGNVIAIGTVLDVNPVGFAQD